MKILLAALLSASALFCSVDINHATIDQLKSLNGIGESKAAKITAYIEKNGCFKKIEELSNIKGIGESFISKNKDMIKIIPCN
jgi:competence protein ComEA